ncbi:MAG: peptide ABC transporter substrate-binding protein [Dehalococcoidia bacterium]|nr:peptide ABC transporter substrate-binding protein [Dehalococcoidia bacterium]MCA9843355.1 peptide ABC transporter substrate-binding protein [Dehalococcoidia bacterium]MCA9853918.1 peptide ABC transporter substrate-binding protein [Dehalococcoidia bacterium]
MRKTKWWMLFSILTVFALTFAVACGDDDDDDDTDGGNPTATSDDGDNGDNGDTQAGGEITVQITEPEGLDPHFSDFSVDITVIQMTNRGLYDLLPGGELRPAMADGMPEVSDDGLTYTVKIKEGLQWSDGETLDANDFVFGIQRTCDPTIAGHYQYILTNIAGCDDYYGGEGSVDDVGVAATDNNTFVITLHTAQATFPSLLALWPTYPAPDEGLASVDADWPAPPDSPCSGPFCPTEWVAGDHITLVKNENYSLGEAKLDKITLRIIDDLSVALNAYDAGELDMIRVSTTDLPQVRDRDDYQNIALPITIGLEPLMTDPLLKDLNVRLALSRATDRELLNEVVGEGANIPTTNWVPAEEPGANEAGAFDDVVGFDAEAAKKLLADAGYPNGEGFPGLTMLLTDSEGNRVLGEFLQEQWKQILGIELSIDFVDGQTRQARFNSSDFQLTTGGWGHDYPDAENWLVGLYETGASINKQKCSDPEIDAALAKAKVETDNEARWEELRKAERRIVETACGMMPLYHRGNHYLINEKLVGVTPTLEDHYLPQFPEDWALAAE